ncbi:MAG: hypothetical protein QMD85_05800, partial [Candidatus Aenigmarchaeota archaeon]|nr:hypothetical protein [Candidatus Aenigmarchaeota archaeon]
MKGQNTIINEILLFAMGISITAAVITNFQLIQKSSTETTIYRNFDNVANTVINGITEVMKEDYGKVVIKIPDRIASVTYRIKVSSDILMVSVIDNPRINITKSLFNISHTTHGHPEEREIIYGDVVSTARYIEIISEKSPSGLTKTI